MIEFQNFGLNALTVSFVATILFSLWAAWGLLDQVRKIWRNRSGEAVSNVWFICATALFGAMAVYGISIGSIAVIFAGTIRSALHIPVLVGLKKFKGFSRGEWFLAGCLAALLVVMVVVPWKGIVFISIAIGTLIPTAAQPLEIWWNKAVGVVSIKLLVVYLVSTTFWIVYALAINDVFVLLFSAASWILFAATVMLWIAFRPRSAD